MHIVELLEDKFFRITPFGVKAFLPNSMNLFPVSVLLCYSSLEYIKDIGLIGLGKPLYDCIGQKTFAISD